jgi:hypothetical protein
MIFRSENAKKDLLRSWNRPDRPFFAAGACHVLAAVFLETYPEAGYHSLFIRPEAGYRGSHVVVSNGRMIFDYHGYTKQSAYLIHYFSKIRRFFPQWQGAIERLKESPIEEPFCKKHQYRMPYQYLCDPRLRALSYLQRFDQPYPLVADPSTSSG